MAGIQKTNVARLLDKAKIPYELVPYTVDECNNCLEFQTDLNDVSNENVLILVIDGTVRLVTDHQIKMAAGEQLTLFVLHLIDAVHHGLIG